MSVFGYWFVGRDSMTGVLLHLSPPLIDFLCQWSGCYILDWCLALPVTVDVTTISVILSSNKIQNGDILVLAYPGCHRKWPLIEYLLLLPVFLGRLPKVDLIILEGGNVRPYVRPSTKSFFDFDEIWYIGRGRWVMHDGMPYGRIQGQGHEPLKVWIPSIFKTYLLRHLQ